MHLCGDGIVRFAVAISPPKDQGELAFVSLMVIRTLDMETRGLSLLLLVFIGAAYAAETYSTQYDKVDVDAILKNDRILKRYVDCLMERTKRCTPDAKLLKEVLPDALKSECSKCSDAQKKMAGKILAYILQYKRNYWDELTEKYDPDGNFRKKHGYGEDSEDIDYSNYE